MANRRMFARSVTESDQFLDLTHEAQLLWFHLGMSADDDGFVDSPKRIMRMVGVGTDALAELMTSGFASPFDSGILLLMHWRVCNSIQKDRYTPTLHQEEFADVTVDGKTRIYLVGQGADTGCIQDVSNLYAQYRLGKGSIGKARLGEGDTPAPLHEMPEEDASKATQADGRAKKTRPRFEPPTYEDVDTFAAEKGIAVDSGRFVDYYAASGWRLSNGNQMKDWRAAVRNWARRGEAQGGRSPAVGDGEVPRCDGGIRLMGELAARARGQPRETDAMTFNQPGDRQDTRGQAMPDNVNAIKADTIRIAFNQSASAQEDFKRKAQSLFERYSKAVVPDALKTYAPAEQAKKADDAWRAFKDGLEAAKSACVDKIDKQCDAMQDGLASVYSVAPTAEQTNAANAAGMQSGITQREADALARACGGNLIALRALRDTVERVGGGSVVAVVVPSLDEASRAVEAYREARSVLVRNCLGSIRPGDTADTADPMQTVGLDILNPEGAPTSFKEAMNAVATATGTKEFVPW